MRVIAMTLRWSVMFSLWLSVPSQAAPLLPFGPTPSEMALMPEYCKVKFTADPRSDEFRAWADRIGPSFSGFHHFCAGINSINRYVRLVNDPKRGYYLSRALPEIDYVARSMTPESPWASEVFLYRGIAQKLAGNVAGASVDFRKSLEGNRSESRAYLNLAELDVQGGNRSGALETVTEGLRHNPTSKALLSKYRELGGKEPPPLPAAQKTDRRENAGPAPVTLPRTDESPQLSPGATPAPRVDAPGKPEGRAGSGAEPRVREDNTGKPTKPKNPSCRFCPEN